MIWGINFMDQERKKYMKAIFKKTFAVFTSVLTAGILVSATYSSSAAALRNGDTNGDGVVDIYDAINISKHVLKKPELTGTNLEQADYNKDGAVNVYDAVFVCRLILCEGKLNEVAALINMGRLSNGEKTLTIDQSLVDAAMKRASELPKKFSGDYRPDNSGFETILTEYGIEFSECANCVAAVPSTPNELYNAMMEKETIKSRLMDGTYTKIGVGYCLNNDTYKHYWAILLI